MNTPWTSDASSLVDAYRKGDHDPVTEVEATLAAIEASEVNAFSFIAADEALAAARQADVSLPLGGVPIAVKELDQVAGWPLTEASLVFRDRRAERDSELVRRLRGAGAVLVGLTTSSEFGGVNLTFTKLNGPTLNPWDHTRTPGGSSGGSAAAVADGLVPLATGGDGGGSIRIPAAFTGLPGLKATYGRIPRGPDLCIGSLTAVTGCLSRSVRDIARYFDVCNGFDPRDPTSLPRVEGWEAGLGSHAVRGMRVALTPDLGVAVVDPEVAERVMAFARELAGRAGLDVVEVPIKLPGLALEWALAGLAEIRKDLGDRWPDCADELTPQIRVGLELADKLYNIEVRARIEATRTMTNEAMADVFDDVDFVMTCTNPDVAFGARGPLPSMVGGVEAGLGNNGALTIPANITGNPAISIPAGTVRGLPVGLQVIARHHAEPLLLELALLAERDAAPETRLTNRP
jgi:aspartyl-tRNA(Asn)/glutamyl-tRNA(Gln) amidotransferase subunit A